MTTPTFQLQLLHGREHPGQHMDDWGFNGPLIIGIRWMHWTYGVPGAITFVSEEAADAAAKHLGSVWERDTPVSFWGNRNTFEDMLVTGEPEALLYWGDWEFQASDGGLVPL